MLGIIKWRLKLQNFSLLYLSGKHMLSVWRLRAKASASTSSSTSGGHPSSSPLHSSIQSSSAYLNPSNVKDVQKNLHGTSALNHVIESDHHRISFRGTILEDFDNPGTRNNFLTSSLPHCSRSYHRASQKKHYTLPIVSRLLSSSAIKSAGMSNNPSFSPVP